MYGFVRFILAAIIVISLVLLTKLKRLFFVKRGVFIASTFCSVLLISYGLNYTTFENQLGGFRTAMQAIEYKYGKKELLYTAQDESSVLLISKEKINELLHFENGRYRLVSSFYTVRKHLYSNGIGVSIVGDKRDHVRFAILTIFPQISTEIGISDNKGNVFSGEFVSNGVTYYIGTFFEDGKDYKIYLDGEDVGLVEIN
jgi:hypothetical protein